MFPPVKYGFDMLRKPPFKNFDIDHSGRRTFRNLGFGLSQLAASFWRKCRCMYSVRIFYKVFQKWGYHHKDAENGKNHENLIKMDDEQG